MKTWMSPVLTLLLVSTTLTLVSPVCAQPGVRVVWQSGGSPPQPTAPVETLVQVQPTEVAPAPATAAPTTAAPGAIITEPLPGPSAYEDGAPSAYADGAPSGWGWGSLLGGNSCGPRLTAQVDYLHWWIKDGPLAEPLVTSGNVVNPLDPTVSSGPIGNPGTVVLFGGQDLCFGSVGGISGSVAYHLNESLSVQIGGFWLPKQTIAFQTASSEVGDPIIARPFFDVEIGRELDQLIGFPNAFAGRITINATTRLWGAEANLQASLLEDDCYRIKGLVGVRFAELQEDIDIRETTTILPNGIAAFGLVPGGGAVFALLPTDTLVIDDIFRTRNRFYGGQVGVEGEWRNDCGFILGLTAKLAVGYTRQVLEINGATNLIGFDGLTGSLPGGILAVATNSGRQTRDELTIMPEVGFKAGYQVTNNLTVHAGYSFMYWSNVVRPGDQITRRGNPEQVPSSLLFNPPANPPEPQLPFQQTDFWAQGVQLGLTFSY